jgi:hypothetical protein
MKTINFPYLALALGLFLLMLVTKGSETVQDGTQDETTVLPLLTLLIANECAFILSAIGAFIGLKNLKTINFKFSLKPLYTITTVLCILLTIQFTLLGINLWPL